MLSTVKVIGVALTVTLGFSSQAFSQAKAKAKPKARTAIPAAGAKMKAPVATSSRISVSGPAAMMGVKGTAPVTAGGVSGTAPLIGSDGASTLTTIPTTAAEQARFRADLSDGVLADMNDALANLLDAVSDVNVGQETGLDAFVTETVPSWACGDACALTVTEALQAGAELTDAAVSEGTAVTAGKAFGFGLESMGLLGAAQNNCPVELGSVIGG